MLIALYELAKPFLFKPYAGACSRVPSAARPPSPPLPPPSADEDVRWGPFLEIEQCAQAHKSGEPPCGIALDCSPLASQAHGELPSSIAVPEPSESTGIDPSGSVLSLCVHVQPFVCPYSTVSVSCPQLSACTSTVEQPVINNDTQPLPQARSPLEERTPLARARPVRGCTRSSAKNLERAISSLLAPSSTSTARASGARSPGVGQQY